VQRAPVEISDLAYDTRAVGPGALFFCVPGERHDGHAFARDAVERGAVALVVERVLELDVSQLVVPGRPACDGPGRRRLLRRPDRTLEVAGVTGTNGKTTTTFLLHSILGAAGRRPGLLGTIESLIGASAGRRSVRRPRRSTSSGPSVRCSRQGDRSCALEATSHGSELGRLDGVRFSALAFTNLSQDHLDFHGTFERYFDAKRRLFVPGRAATGRRQRRRRLRPPAGGGAARARA
jgi:UDP-N-acetylmuramoyl-L-alanyl-D-glutamate--2,6-diaminopimelate ligase